jgi:ATP-dependent Lhr-like helicase
MISQPLNYSQEKQSNSFGLLDPKIQRWIWRKGWESLRDIQEIAIRSIIENNSDIIIASPTASGKTEAVILPIFSKIMSKNSNSIDVLYISPLKALINDQYDRLTEIANELNIQVTKWHGDAPATQKKKLLAKPTGVLLITPESLEAICIINGPKVISLFHSLSYIIIDELHYFIGTERGKQVQSLIQRIESTIKKTTPHIGLSATLRDMETVPKDFLRFNNPYEFKLIESKESEQTIKLQIKGYIHCATNVEDIKNSFNDGSDINICNDIFKLFRGQTNLIFTNKRTTTEQYSDILNRLSDKNNVPNEFYPHHGSLSKEIRHDVEKRLKDKTKPTNVLCTSTLELGIDIGSVYSIGQIGIPPSVSSIRQRLGRSGREKGKPSILRMFIKAEEIDTRTILIDRLRQDLFQSIASVELLIKSEYEKPRIKDLHLSTLIQQILSLIAQYGGIKAIDAFRLLCQNGPFKNIDEELFIKFIRNIGDKDLVTQSSDGLLILGLSGERLVNHYSFYTAFNTTEEYQIIAFGKSIGTLPVTNPLVENAYIIFAGKRWIVTSVDQHKKIIEVSPSKGGRPPKFGGSGFIVDDQIRQKMFNIYTTYTKPIYLDQKASELFDEGKKYFNDYNINDNCIIKDDTDLLLFLWIGDIITSTIIILLISEGYKATNEGIAIRVMNCDIINLKNDIQKIIKNKNINSIDVVKNVKNKQIDKYDYLLNENLLNRSFCSKMIDLNGAINILSTLRL